MKYGWKRDITDPRDFKSSYKPEEGLSNSCDLRALMPDIYNQGHLGSCTSNAIAALIESDLKRQELFDFMPSRLFIYYNERDLENTVGEDSGAQIRDGMKTINNLGIAPETYWPYSDSNPGPFSEKPPATAYQEAKKNVVTSYARVDQDEMAIKNCLSSKKPIVFGFTVYDSFETQAVTDTGIVPMPKNGENILGGHAVLIIGFDDTTRRFLVRNSWGTNWGDNGYFTMPYEYVLDSNLSNDFWTIDMIVESSVPQLSLWERFIKFLEDVFIA